MSLSLTAAEVLAQHVSFELECPDRLYLNLYCPKLQYPTGIVGYCRERLGAVVASTVLTAKLTNSFVARVERYASAERLDFVSFAKAERKDDVAKRYLGSHDGTETVLFIGKAQEKVRIPRTEKRRHKDTGKTYPWIVMTTGVVNQFYFYAFDDDFGPFFIKFSSYFPFNGRLYVNAHEWLKCQADKAGVGYEALDNGFKSCTDPGWLAARARDFGPDDIGALLSKWLRKIPAPFTPADTAAGYRHQISILQAEFSLTQVLDRPVAGRVLFEDIIRNNLDLGRPSQVSLIFDRQVRTKGPRPTPGSYRTRVITEGVAVSIHVDYKHSKIKQYHKENLAVRTETTINDTNDFGVRKALSNLPVLAKLAFAANRRLLATEVVAHDPIRGDEVFSRVCAPALVDNQRVPGLRFGDPRAHALFASICLFVNLVDGFTHADLRRHLADALGLPPGSITSGQTTYDLRRLRLHGLIARLPHSNRYRPTPLGYQTAVFFVHTYDRYICPGLSEITDPSAKGPLRSAFAKHEATLALAA